MSRRVAVAVTLLTASTLGGCGPSDAAPGPASTLPVAPAPTILPEPPAEPMPDLGPFTRATVVVPDWGPGVPCATGRVTVPNGQHVPSHGRVLNLMAVVTSDVDRDGVEDYVAEILCGEGPESPGWQAVAFRRSGDTLFPIGRVIGSQDGFAMMSGLKAVTKDRIAVNVSNQYTDSGEQYVPHQWRTYAWQAGRFSQVDGPTSFPANPPAARLSVDPADLYFRPAQDGRYVGDLTVTARNSGDAAVANAVLTFFLPFEVRPAGGAWSDCTMLALTTSSTSIRIDCPLGGLAAETSRSMTVQLVAVDRPRVQGSITAFSGEPANHHVVIGQRPPYTFQDSGVFETDIRIVLPD